MNKLILFDIDHTLFDTKKFLYDLFYLFAQKLHQENSVDFIHTCEQIFHESKDERLYVDIKVFIKKLTEKIDAVSRADMLEKAYWEGSIFENALYPQTVETLETLAKISGVTLGIFSRGNSDVQKKKIQTITHFFEKEHIHIFSEKSHELQSLLTKYTGKKLYFIDDSLRILKQAKEMNPLVTTIWILQGEVEKNRMSASDFTADYTIKSLGELLSVINR